MSNKPATLEQAVNQLHVLAGEEYPRFRMKPVAIRFIECCRNIWQLLSVSQQNGAESPAIRLIELTANAAPILSSPFVDSRLPTSNEVNAYSVTNNALDTCQGRLHAQLAMWALIIDPVEPLISLLRSRPYARPTSDWEQLLLDMQARQRSTKCAGFYLFSTCGESLSLASQDLDDLAEVISADPRKACHLVLEALDDLLVKACPNEVAIGEERQDADVPSIPPNATALIDSSESYEVQDSLHDAISRDPGQELIGPLSRTRAGIAIFDMDENDKSARRQALRRLYQAEDAGLISIIPIPTNRQLCLIAVSKRIDEGAKKRLRKARGETIKRRVARSK